MYRIIYHLRDRRAQKVRAFKLPSTRKSDNKISAELGSYLSQSSGVGRNFKRFASPRKRHKVIWLCIAVLFLLLFGWIVPESIAAIELFQK